MLEDSLSRFEDHIQRLIEGGFARLFSGRLHPREVAVRLARAMEDNLRQAEQGTLLAPDVFYVRLNPLDHTALLNDGANLVERLQDELVEMARAVGLVLLHHPEVRILADKDIPLHHVDVTAQHAAPRLETTQTMQDADLAQFREIALPEAYLVLENGTRRIPIIHPVINLGRHRDNDIILDDPSVSRHHAQLRLRFGHYVLFDLGSTRGTLVNGQPGAEHTLQSGDVITLANSRLIYIEQLSGPEETSASTQAFPRIVPDS
nr:FHA domain-containing protein [Anaerolineae bacterium]